MLREPMFVRCSSPSSGCAGPNSAMPNIWSKPRCRRPVARGQARQTPEAVPSHIENRLALVAVPASSSSSSSLLPLLPPRPDALSEQRRHHAVELQTWVVQQYALGRFSAPDLVRVAYHLERCCLPVVQGLVAPLENAVRACTKALGIDRMLESLYIGQIPVHDLKTASRRHAPHPFALPHWLLDQEHHDGRLNMGSAVLRSAPVFAQHPLVLAHGAERAVPAGIFVDAADWARDGSSLLAWVCTLGCERRHVITMIDKNLMCRCGCHDRCTFVAIEEVIRCQACSTRANHLPLAAHMSGGQTNRLVYSPCSCITGGTYLELGSNSASFDGIPRGRA